VVLAAVVVPINARLLGPEGFAFAAAGIAGANILMPWLTFASPHSIVRLVVRQKSQEGIGRLTMWSVLLGSTLLALGATVALVSPARHTLVGVAAMAFEFLAVAPSQIVASAALAQGRHRVYAIWATSPALTRVLAASSALMLTITTTASGTTSFAITHITFGILLAVGMLTKVWETGRVTGGFFQGFVALAGTQTSARVYDDGDKLLLPYLSSAMAAGNYAATYRLLAYALAPVRALLMALMPRLMEHRESPAVLGFVRETLPKVVGVSVGAVALLAPTTLLGMTWILGPGFTADSSVVALLCLAFVLRSAHYVMADALSATDRDVLRLVVQVGLGCVSIAITALLIIKYGALGAALATAAMEVFAVLVYSMILLRAPK
jgi:O-antigen/teichoic acid export membrane protein